MTPFTARPPTRLVSKASRRPPGNRRPQGGHKTARQARFEGLTMERPPAQLAGQKQPAAQQGVFARRGMRCGIGFNFGWLSYGVACGAS